MNRAYTMSPFSRRVALTSLIVSVSALALLSGCKPAKTAKDTTPPSDKPAATSAHKVSGRLDWASWQRWVQGQPRVVLVKTINRETLDLIERQVLLFQSVTGDSIQVNLPPAEYEQLRQSFIASGGSRSGNNPVPAVERWDRYSNAVLRMQTTDAKTTLGTLESFVRRDRQELTPRQSEKGDIGWQARSDLGWIDGQIMPIIEKLKSLTSTQLIPAARAKTEWQTFEKGQLAAIARAISAATVDRQPVAADGTYTLSGDGQVVAILNIGGRDLYFPADIKTPGLNF